MFRAANIAIPLECVKCAPLEGEWKMRESASPSEGVEGLLEMEMRLYGGLAAMVHLRTFGR